MLRKIYIIIITVLLLSCNRGDEKTTFNFLALNTTCSVTIFGQTDINQEEIINLVNKIEQLMSRHISNSDISQINNLSGKGEFIPEKMTLEVLKKGFYYSDFSNGKFDISIGPLVKLWNIEEAVEPPNKDDINKQLKLVNYKDIVLEDNNSVRLNKEGMILDLGGIAKGYAADQVKKYLLEHGVKSGIVNLGGNINLIGNKPDSSLWKIGIQHPNKDRGQFIGILSMENSSFVTSGNYERYFIYNGIRYHHIINTQDGYPLNGDIISSSIISDKSIDGDALSTISFGLTTDKAIEYTRNAGVKGVFITESEIYIASEIADNFILKDDTYRLIKY